MNALHPARPALPGADPRPLVERIVRLCATLSPVPGHATLLDALRREGGPEFVPRVSRGGWFRPGRILDGAGRHIAEDALGWLEQAWNDAGEDGEAFAERYADAGYVLTREQGITHYLVAPYGPSPADYLQLEIEELQEMRYRALVSGAEAADSVEALLERPQDAPPPVPLGAPRYRLRRLTDAAAFVARIAAQTGRPAPVLRFLDEWRAGSPGRQRHLSDHWVLALSEHLDRYRQPRCGAVPVAAHAPQWTGGGEARGIALAQQLYDFDRAAGYAFAWYFHMVSGHRVPRDMAPRVFADLQDGMAYLPERDAALVAAWMREPYSL
jgi:hypothetical protein